MNQRSVCEPIKCSLENRYNGSGHRNLVENSFLFYPYNRYSCIKCERQAQDKNERIPNEIKC